MSTVRACFARLGSARELVALAGIGGALVSSGCYLLEERERRASPSDAATLDATAPRDAAVPGDAAARCDPADRSSWSVEVFDAGGDYDRFAPALRGLPWVALRERDGNVVFLELGVDATGIVVRHRVELPDSPVYPLAFDTDATRFALLATSGSNWNGTPSLWVLDTSSGELARADWPEIGPESAFTYRASLGLVGRDVVVASVSAADDLAWIELRDERLEVLERVEQPQTLSIVGVHGGPERVELYLRTRPIGTRAAFAVAPTGITFLPEAGSEHEIIGGLHDYLVEHDLDFRLRRGDRIWSAEWPGSQISPPAVVRLHGEQVAFSLEKELSGVVGYTNGDALEWLHVEPRPGASGIGVAMLPVVEARRLGLFYLGLEIPHPEQPIRYYGVACE